jgi:hypothetical protein
MPWLSDNIPGAMALVGVGLMLVILLRKYFRYQQSVRREVRRDKIRSKSRPGGPKKKEKPKRRLVDTPAEVTRWQVEFYDTCRDMKGELDTKMRAL